jgi:hypothetical protein
MFKRGLFMAFVALTSLACSKDNPSEQEAQQTQMATLEVNVAEGITTRATSVNDANIGTAERDIQVLVFNSEGDLLAYGANEDSSTKVSLSIPTGTVECYAVVNSYDDLSVIATKTVFLKHISHLKDNDPTRMEMLGSVTKSVVAGENSVSIAVKRFASKVQIDKITPAFTAPAHRAMEFKLTGIYLINVNGTCPYTMVPTAASESTSWYNKRKYVSGDCNHLITDKLSTPVVMQTAAGVVTPYSKSHYLYCYPNPVTTDVSTTTWSERVSRLVVETTLGGTTYYYSVNIPTPQCNTVYQITNMKITGIGTDTPDAVVQKGSLSVSLTVTDWSTGFSKEVEY